MFYKIFRQLGFILIANSTVFMPIIASADSGVGSATVGGAFFGFIAGALITAFSLVSASRTKKKAQNAKKYQTSAIRLHESRDTFVRSVHK